MTVATAVARSKNAKIGLAAATYASQTSCPSVCPLRGAGCYAESGSAGFTTHRLNREPTTVTDVAQAEADAIDTLDGRLDLRIHVVGDCSTNESAQMVSAAAERYQERSGGDAWTYTHAWRDVDRASWGTVSVLASVESPEDALIASERGYAAAMIVPIHPENGRAYKLPTGQTAIPCAEQTRGRTCVECRLCLDSESLKRRNAVITFAAHGSRARMVRETIEG